MVIHLTTAADGAANQQSLSNNSARKEDLEFAIELDKKVKNAYLGHPRVHVITNSEGKTFEDKLNKCAQKIEHLFNKHTNDNTN